MYLVMDEELLLEQVKIIAHFSRKFNNSNYVIVSDEIKSSWQNYYRQYIGFMSENEYSRNNGCTIEAMGKGAYYHVDNTIYIAVPYISDEFTLLRTLTHEYGHCIQDKSGYNRATCDSCLLEYHNIWFHENPYNRDTLSNFNRINKVSGFRVSSINECKGLIDRTQYYRIDNYFKVSFNEFCDMVEQRKSAGYINQHINHKPMLRDIYEFIRNKLDNYQENLLYYTLFNNFLRSW